MNTFIQRALEEFYAAFAPPPWLDVDKREFGIGFDKKINTRHLSFQTLSELRRYLVKERPLYVSFSVSRYRYPGATPMAHKERIDSEMVIDLDAPLMKEDPANAEAVLDQVHWIKEILTQDFGLNDLEVYFSGNKGFHIYVLSPKDLSVDERREIFDYLSHKIPNFLGDAQVTVDMSRLIRLPGSIHGGGGMVVRRFDHYDPLLFLPPLNGYVVLKVHKTLDWLGVDIGVQSVERSKAFFLVARGWADVLSA